MSDPKPPMTDVAPRWWVTDPDGKLRVTHDPGPEPADHDVRAPNCRCVVVPVLPEGDATRRLLAHALAAPERFDPATCEPSSDLLVSLYAPPPKSITYFGKPLTLSCDGLCGKAWGINNRPRVRFDEEDDYAFLADHELGEAPADPGTYEGADGKPVRPADRLNRWCARECERSTMTPLGKEVVARDFSRRVYNQPWKHEGVRDVE